MTLSARLRSYLWRPLLGPAVSIPSSTLRSWIFFSNLTILFNKWVIDNKGFRYPVILTFWHLLFATIATQILARTTRLLDGRKAVRMTGRTYLRAIVPIGLLYSASLVCSNIVYLYLSVAFIQMLKAAAPVAVLLISWAWGVETPSLRRFMNILVIVAGVALASFGEIDFSWPGFFFQLGGIVFEGLRLVLIQVLLTGDERGSMDPLVSLYYYAPVCAAMNLVVAIASEGAKFDPADIARAGWGLLLLNAAVAFLLNVSSVFLIGKTSGLVMTLTGILKNILLVVVSVAIWATPISQLQCLGYSIALAGLVYYSLGWDHIIALVGTSVTYARGGYELLSSSSRTEAGHGSASDYPFAVRRGTAMGLAAVLVTILVGGFLFGGSASQIGTGKTWSA